MQTQPQPAPKRHAVENGVIRSISVSQEKKAAGCERQWHLNKVLHLPEPKMKAQVVGTESHAQLEHYAKTGEDVLGEVAQSFKPYIPQLGSVVMLAEWAFNNKPKVDDGEGGNWFDPAESLLRVDGIPLIGFVDRLTCWPERGVVRVTDYKTCSSFNYNALPEQLCTVDLDAVHTGEPRRACPECAPDVKATCRVCGGTGQITLGSPDAGIQMVGYGIFASMIFPWAHTFELEHLYGLTKFPKHLPLAERARQVLVSVPLAHLREQWAKLVPLVRRQRVLAATTKLADSRPNWNACSRYGGCAFQAQCLIHQSKGRKAMGVMDLIKKGAPAPVATTEQPEFRANETGIIPDPPREKLVQDIVEPKPGTPVPVVQFQKPADPKTPTHSSLCEGSVGAPCDLPQVCAPAVLPPDAPKSDPALAAEPLVLTPAPADAEKPKRTRRTKAEMEAARAAEAAQAITPPAAQPPVTVNGAVEIEAPKAGQAITPSPASGTTTVSVHRTLDLDQVQALLEPAPVLCVFIDALPNCPAEPLAGYVGKIVGQIEAAFKVVDIRTAPKKLDDGRTDHPLAFGGWKGALAGAIKCDPPPPGVYVALGTAGSEIMQVAAEALESLLADAPGCFVRGVR